jgi:hypothetical protein
MLYKCANPTCSERFRRISQGKLFEVEMEYSTHHRDANSLGPRRREYYWLCDQCACFLTLVMDKAEGAVIVPLPGFVPKKPVAAAHNASGSAYRRRVAGWEG